MYPTIHDYTARDLTTQGFGSLSDCISCEVTEELNGAFTLEMKYPLNGLRSEYLTTGSIIMAKPSHNQGKQPFRISEVKRSFANNIDVYANHICYDLSGYPVRASASYNSLASVINAMNAMTWSTGTSAYNQFSFSTDKTSSAAFKMEGLQTLRSWMGGQEGSIIDTYGGEWVYNGFDCYLASRRGEDTGYRISYGKNLEEYEKQKTYADYSHIVAFWKKAEVVAYSDLVATGVSCAFRCAYYDASNDYENQPTVAQLNTLAASKASGLGVDVQTITITPAQIGNDVIGLGDSVLVCYETVLKTRVVKTVWDVLGSKYTTIQLGTKQVNIADTIKSLSTAPSGESGSSGDWNLKQNAGLGTPTATDFNNITTAGNYWVNPDVSSTNRPNNDYGILQVLRADGNNGGVIEQVFYSYRRGIFWREFANNQWYEWKGGIAEKNTATASNGYVIDNQLVRRVGDIVYARIQGHASQQITSANTKTLVTLPYSNSGVLISIVSIGGNAYARVNMSGKNVSQAVSTTIASSTVVDFQLAYFTWDNYL